MSFGFDLGADNAREQAEALAGSVEGSGFLNLKKITEGEPYYFRILPPTDSTIAAIGSAIGTIKKWVFQGYEEDESGNKKYLSTSSPKSLGKKHAKDKDFGDWLVSRMEREIEREHYERDEDGNYTGDPILDENENEIMSLYVEDTENEVVQIFRTAFKYATKSGKPHPLKEGEKIGDHSPLRFPDKSSSVEYWIAAVQVEPDLDKDEDGDKISIPMGDPVILSCPRSVFVQIVGGWLNGGEIPGLAKNKEIGHLLTEQNGIDIVITRTPRKGQGSNFEVSGRMSATGSQSWIADDYYEDENRIDMLARLKEGINTDECIEAFKVVIGDIEKPIDDGEAAAASISKSKGKGKSKGKSKGKVATSTPVKGKGKGKAKADEDDEDTVDV